MWIEVEHGRRKAALRLHVFPLGRAHIAPIQAARLDNSSQDPWAMKNGFYSYFLIVSRYSEIFL